MKNILFIVYYIFIAAITLFALISCGNISTSPAHKKYSGWAIGERLHNGYGVVIHTSNSGKDWELQVDEDLFKGILMSDVSAINDNIAFICGYSLDNEHGYIFMTTDAGATWENADISGIENIKPLGCIRSEGSTIIAGGMDGFFLISNDLGKNWQTKNIPTIGDGYSIIRIGLDGSNRLIANLSSSTEEQTIFYSYDGGNNWHPHTSIPDGWTSIIDVSWVKESNTIWASGAYHGNDGIIAVSKDAGKNWVAIDSAGLSHFNAIFAYDKNHIWAGADHMNFNLSSDGGNTWAKQQLSYNDIWVGGISAVSKSELWVVGCGLDSPQTATSTILHSSDGGSSWEVQNVPENVSALWRVSFSK
jgi:photosystem II stability/assembly factor-like uncharacterized protein